MITEIKNHRSVRAYLSKPIPEEVMNDCLAAATRASTVGTMQLYSIVVTTAEEIRARLAPCHFNQSMVAQAPAVVTFCADTARFEQWCSQRQAEPDYKNPLWFQNATIDAILASQNFCLEAQHNGLGICYLGTTLYTAERIIDILGLPEGVFPVTTVVVGYPDLEKFPAELTPRLPMEAVVHRETYKVPTAEDIDSFWHDTEMSELTAKLLKDNALPNLAKIFTQRRYTSTDSAKFSAELLKTLTKQKFL